MAVICDADRGTPPRELIWLRNGLPIVLRSKISNDSHILIIENATDSDAGLYKCVLYSENGPIVANITLNLIDPELLPIVNPDLPLYLPITYRHTALRLDCRNPEAQPDVLFSWMNPNSEEVTTNHLLEVEPEDVIPGVYTCLAYTMSGDEVLHTVIVTLRNTPPIPVDSNVIFINAVEQGTYSSPEEFRYQLDRTNLSVDWKRYRLDELVDFHFGSRFMFDISATTVVFRIDNVQLTDRGQYLVNVSNQFGYTELRVNIHVAELLKTTMQVRFTGISCSLVAVSPCDNYSYWWGRRAPCKLLLVQFKHFHRSIAS